MILAARDAGCLAEMLVIASALAVPDPRERPLEKQQAADQAHLRFRDERSDFLSLLALWQFFADALAAEAVAPASWSSTAARISFRTCGCANGATCTGSSPSRSTELGWRWTRRAAGQDRRRALRGDPSRAARGPAVEHRHASADGDEHYLGARGHPVLPASRLGHREERRRNGCSPPSSPRRRACTRAARRGSSPSGSSRSPAIASSAATSIRTGTRARGEVVGERARRALRPDAGAAAARFLRRDRSGGRARGLPARGAGRRRARDARAPFLAHNRQLVAEIAELEHKARRQDVLVDDEAIYAFYAERIPAGICTRPRRSSTGARDAEATEPRLLFMTREALMRHAAAQRHRGAVSGDRWRLAGARAAAQVPLRAGPSARRSDADRAARAAEPDRRGAAVAGSCRE